MNGIDVAYVLLRFPHLTETFVAEEIRMVQNLGITVHIYSLLKPRKGIVHPVSVELASQTHYVPAIYSLSLWWAQCFFLIKDPGTYFKLLRILLQQPSPKPSFFLKRTVIFLKAVWLAKRLQKSPIRLLHTHFAWLSAAASMVISRLLDIPYTVTTHAYDIYSIKNDLLTLITEMADRVVTISDFNKQAMLEMNPSLNGDRIEIIHCGIDLEYFCSKYRGQQNQKFQITSIGTLIEKKGHEYLIRACRELRKQEINFDCMIIGEGELEGKMQDLIQDLDLDDSITLAGAQIQSWVRNRLDESDLFVLASVIAEEGGRDGIPVAIMEALAMKVPVVSTVVSGIPELIRHGETGLLVPERDETKLAAAMSLLIQDRALGRKLAQNGRILVESDYDITKNASQLVGLFQRVIQEQE